MRTSSKAPPDRARRGGTRFVPRLDALEDRSVPSTFYIDPALAGSANGSTVTFDAGKSDEQTGLRYASTAAFYAADVASNPTATYAFSDLRQAINASEINAGPDTVRLAQVSAPIPLDNTAVATAVNGGTVNSVNVTQPLTLAGGGTAATVIAPTANTQFDDGTGAVDDNLTSVFRVNGAGASLTATDLTFDGSGRALGIGFSIQNGAAGSFDRVDVRNVAFSTPSEGIALEAFAAASLAVARSSFEGYGRVGIQFANTSGSVTDSQISGRGAVSEYNVGIDVYGKSTVLVSGNTITGNVGRTGGFFSTGVLAYADPADPTRTSNVTLIGNTVTGNANGIALGLTGTPDGSSLSAQYNNITGNDVGASNESGTSPIQAPNNWWGSPSGPFNATTNPAGNGDAVTTGVTFTNPLPTVTPVVAATSVSDYLNQISVIGTNIQPPAGQSNPVRRGPVQFTVTFAQPVSGFTASDVTVATTTGGTPVVAVTGSGTTYTVAVTGLTGAGTVSATVPAGGAVTTDGFLNAASNTATAAFDDNPNIVATTVAPQAGQPSPVRITPVRFTVTFAQPVTGFDATDVVVTSTAGGTPRVAVTGSGTTYTVAVDGVTGAGNVSVRVPAGAATTADAFFNAASNTATVAFDDTQAIIGTVVEPAASQPNPARQSPVRFTVTFAQPVTGFDATDVVVTSTAGGTPQATVSGSGTVYTVTIDGLTGAGNVSVQIPARAATTADGFRNAASNTATLALDVPIPDNLSNPKLVGVRQTAVGAESGNTSVVVLERDGTVAKTLPQLGAAFAGGVRTATADFNGDGMLDYAVGTGPGGVTQIRVIDGAGGPDLFRVQPFETSFTGGVFVTAGDINNDGKADLVVTPDQGGGPRVLVYFGADFQKTLSFLGIEDPNFRGGARAGVGDVNGDGFADVVVSAGFLGGPRVAGFSGQALASGSITRLFNDFFVFEDTLRNGSYMAVGDVNGDGFADVVAGAGPGGGPRVFVVDGKSLVQNGPSTLVPLANFFGGDPPSRNGIRVAVKNLDQDNRADVVTGPGTGDGTIVNAYVGRDLKVNIPPIELWQNDVFPGLPGGVFVG